MVKEYLGDDYYMSHFYFIEVWKNLARQNDIIFRPIISVQSGEYGVVLLFKKNVKQAIDIIYIKQP